MICLGGVLNVEKSGTEKWNNKKRKNPGSESGLPEFEFPHLHLLELPWAYYLDSLGHSFLVCTLGIMVPNLQMKRSCKAFSTVPDKLQHSVNKRHVSSGRALGRIGVQSDLVLLFNSFYFCCFAFPSTKKNLHTKIPMKSLQGSRII